MLVSAGGQARVTRQTAALESLPLCVHLTRNWRQHLVDTLLAQSVLQVRFLEECFRVLELLLRSWHVCLLQFVFSRYLTRPPCGAGGCQRPNSCRAPSVHACCGHTVRPSRHSCSKPKFAWQCPMLRSMRSRLNDVCALGCPVCFRCCRSC